MCIQIPIRLTKQGCVVRKLKLCKAKETGQRIRENVAIVVFTTVQIKA